MTIDERAEMAFELKATGQCNCTQAVLKAFEDLIPVDEEKLMTLSAGFAAGMGCMESTCGALIGAVMTMGVLSGGRGTPRISKELVQNFKKMCGATICRELKGMETGSVLCECPSCCKNAVLAMKDFIS